MRKIIYPIIINVLFFFLPIALSSCGRSAEEIYSTVRLNAVSEEKPIAINIDQSLKGNFFRNLNTGEEYTYPVLVGGSCTMRVLKGVYIFAFDGTATMEDGSTRKVRCYQHRSPNDSVNILADKEEINFDLMLL